MRRAQSTSSTAYGILRLYSYSIESRQRSTVYPLKCLIWRKRILVSLSMVVLTSESLFPSSTSGPSRVGAQKIWRFELPELPEPELPEPELPEPELPEPELSPSTEASKR